MSGRTQLQILLALTKQGAASWAQLVDAQDSSLPEFHAALEALEKQGRIINGPQGIRLTTEGKEAIANISGSPPLALQCPDCQSKGYIIPEDDPRLRRL